MFNEIHSACAIPKGLNHKCSAFFEYAVIQGLNRGNGSLNLKRFLITSY